MIRLPFTNKLYRFCFLFFTSITIISCHKQPSASPIRVNPPAVADTTVYRNPVFNHDFPDPNLVQGDDGTFYAYSTNTSWQQEGLGGPYTVPILQSKNLVTWTVVGDAFAKKPDWKTDGGIWAPDVTFYNNAYHLYYSFSTWGDPNPGIGVATAATPRGPFTDHGKLFLSSEQGVDNSIDPVCFVDDGKPYLIWGSFHGIYAIELSPDGLALIGPKFRIGGDGYEGSYIYKKDNYYYYFGSTGTCCEGAKSTYQVNVARAASFKGPYVDKSGKPLLENGGTLLLQKDPGSDGFVGTGHNGDIVVDKAGQSWIIYHAYNKIATAGRVMLLDKINWVDGWPVIENAAPFLTFQKNPVF